VSITSWRIEGPTELRGIEGQRVGMHASPGIHPNLAGFFCSPGFAFDMHCIYHS